MKELAPFTPIILSFLGVVAALAGFFFWRMLVRMETKIDLLWNGTVRKEDFEKWKESRKALWNRIHGHAHTPNGKVIITEKAG